MARWFHFALGLVGLVGVAFGVSRIVVGHLPDAWWSGRLAYEAMIALTVAGLVAVTVRAVRKAR